MTRKVKVDLVIPWYPEDSIIFESNLTPEKKVVGDETKKVGRFGSASGGARKAVPDMPEAIGPVPRKKQGKRWTGLIMELGAIVSGASLGTAHDGLDDVLP